MAYITPNSDVIIYQGVPLEKEYNHTVYCESIVTQHDKFTPYTRYTLNNLTYQRVNRNTIRVGMVADQLQFCNYMAFRNTTYGSKWFYAFINEVNYVNDNCTEIVYQIDVMQTYYFDYDLGECFIEREHTATDRIGDNLVPEDVDIGELNVQAKWDFTFPNSVSSDHMYDLLVLYIPNFNASLIGDEYYVTGYDPTSQSSKYGWATEKLNTIASGSTAPAWHWARGDIYAGIYSGCCYITVPMYVSTDSSLAETRRKINGLIMCIQDIKGTIVSMLQVPAKLMEDWEVKNRGSNPNTPVTYTSQESQSNAFYMSDHRTGVTYIAKNNKLLTYPYQSLVVSNNVGNTATLRWENFKSENSGHTLKNCTFTISGVPITSPELMVYPTNYRGLTKDYESAVTLNDFPVASWSTESFTQWWAQNKENFALSNIASAIKVVGTTMTQGALGGAMKGAEAFASSMATLSTAMNTPDSINGQVGASSLRSVENRIGFTFYAMAINAEYARMIDDYFSMYGYAIKKVKLPNIMSGQSFLRPHWNYLKTRGAILHSRGQSIGNLGLPADAEHEISKIYDKGITFWTTLSEIGNYNQNNSPT